MSSSVPEAGADEVGAFSIAIPGRLWEEVGPPLSSRRWLSMADYRGPDIGQESGKRRGRLQVQLFNFIRRLNSRWPMRAHDTCIPLGTPRSDGPSRATKPQPGIQWRGQYLLSNLLVYHAPYQLTKARSLCDSPLLDRRGTQASFGDPAGSTASPHGQN